MSGFSDNWEAEWDNRASYPEWPWTDLVSKIHRHTSMDAGDTVLEIGCGAGANVPFFRDLGVEYYAIEGSESAVSELRDRFPDIGSTVSVGDFTAEIPFDVSFDYVVDRASLTTNSTEAINRCLDLITEQLRPGGQILSVDMYSTAHTEYDRGPTTVDEYTRSGFEQGVFANLGEIHFSSKDHIRELYEGPFEITHLEHKTRTREIPDDEYQYASWDVIATKR
jgi:SAM-dependent methyltransferase